MIYSQNHSLEKRHHLKEWCLLYCREWRIYKAEFLLVTGEISMESLRYLKK